MKMPRQRRRHYRNAFYHVMLRGNNKQCVFNDMADRLKFYSILQNKMHIYYFQIHLFCLMSNHVHLVIQVYDIPLSKIMQSLVCSYTKYFNNKYDKVGHLFGGRYKAKIITNDSYLLELCHYIHCNPIKAGICKSLNEYQWSSHQVYSNQVSLPWVTTEYVNRLLVKHVHSQANQYENFIYDRVTTFEKPVFCTFDDSGNLSIADSVHESSQSSVELNLESIPLQNIADAICKQMNINPSELSSVSYRRDVCLARSMFAYFAHYHAKRSLSDIADMLCMQRDSVRKTMNKHLQKARFSREIRQLIILLERKLSVSDLDNLIL